MQQARSMSVRRAWEFTGRTLKADWSGMAKLSILVCEERTYLNETLEEVADRAGVSPRTVGRIEQREVRYPRFATVVNILNALGFSVTCHSTR